MTAIPPQPFRWTGEAMEPLRPRLADRHYVIGEVYPLVPEEPRSGASHNHEFAWLKEAWLSLPEDMAERFPSAEHLRKRALIDTGFFTESIIDAGSNAAALRVAAYLRGDDEFAVVIVRGPYVAVRKAVSQSKRAMGNAAFQRSKTAILECIAGLIQVEPATLERVVEAV